ncbi:unnamed protein product [Allacma fusca]|uniref:Uncharacterized protein n=1 Tax=Allacma fusca TaxID=39272 RepID=A0A8J2L6H0_9HEXA|nr:unnamed protein product [Allacma fusca]
MKLLEEFLDRAGINTTIVYDFKLKSATTGGSRNRQLFLEELAEELITPHIRRRDFAGLQKHVQESMGIMGVSLPPIPRPASGSRGYYHIYDRYFIRPP